MDDILQGYLEFDAAAERLAEDEALRSASEWLARHLPAGPTVLLARTDAAVMVCAACAVLREDTTRIERAPFGRIDWAPPLGAILVEPVEPSPGLLATIAERWPSLEPVVVPHDVLASAAAVPA